MFEAFLERAPAGRPWRGRLVLGASVALHAGLIAFCVIRSFWHVDSLWAPDVRVTFMPGLVPAGGMDPAVELPRKRRVVRRVPAVVPETVAAQPAPEPASEPEPGSEGAPLPPGLAGGIAGDTGVDGTGAGGPLVLPLEVVRGHLAIDPFQDPYRPRLPAALNRPGTEYRGVVIACVDARGNVESARIQQSAHPQLDPELITRVKLWRFVPYRVGGQPQPFCFMWRCRMRSVWRASRT